MASTPHPPPKHEPPKHEPPKHEPPKHPDKHDSPAKRDHDEQPPVTRAPNAPAHPSSEHRDPQEMKLELAARDRPPETKLQEYEPGQPYNPNIQYATIGDEQRARSAAMEAEGGPEAWMKAHESSPPVEDEARRGVVPGVGTESRR